METPFTPGSGALGGALIGLSAGLLLLVLGRIAGISGILGRALFGSVSDRAWHLAFLLGLPLGAALVGLAGFDTHGFSITTNPLQLVLAGGLVGFGTQLGNGCTSGHGVCGIARGSRRSIVATATFMATAIGTVLITRHALGIS